MRITLKLKLVFFFVALIILPLTAIGFPWLIGRFAVSLAWEFVLLILFVVLFSLFFFLLADLFVTLPFHKLKKQLQRQEKRDKVLIKEDVSSWPQELQEVHNLFGKILKRLEQRNKELKKAKSLNVLKFEFISIISHQLRTPLTGLKWALSMIIEELPSENQKEKKKVLESAQKSLNRILKLVDEFLQNAGIEAEKKSFIRKTERLDVAAMIEDIAVTNQLFTSSRGVILEVRQQQKNIPTVVGSRQQLIVALQNVIANAIYYSSRKQKVVVDLSYQGNFVYVKVKDNGLGISKHEQKHIFERFFRGREAIKMHTSGSGLGLYLTRAIVDKHGGDIYFSSNPGQGSLFTIKLPIKQKGELETFIQY